MRPELILWDWNGTLLDDVELCVDALNRLLEKHAYPQRYDRDQYRAILPCWPRNIWTTTFPPARPARWQRAR